MIITMGWLMPRRSASDQALRSRASSIPAASAARRTGQNPRSSGAPEIPSAATPARNSTKGRNAPTRPPRKRRRAGLTRAKSLQRTAGDKARPARDWGRVRTADSLVRARDAFTLYDLRVEVVAGDKPMVCGHAAGDYFVLRGEMLSFPAGQGFPLYSLAALLP